jgi:hypothetical protein
MLRLQLLCTTVFRAFTFFYQVFLLFPGYVQTKIDKVYILLLIVFVRGHWVIPSLILEKLKATLANNATKTLFIDKICKHQQVYQLNKYLQMF